MRITNRYMANNMLNNIQNNLSKLARSQEQIATSKRMLRPSDDPNMLGQLLSIKNTLSYNEQYARNISDGLSYLDMNDSAMGTLGDVMKKVQELTLQGANDTYNSEDRKAIAEQIDKMIDQVVDLGNSTVGGKYIYGGTTNGDPPFERQGDIIYYKGDLHGVYREVLAGTDYRIDTPGVTIGIGYDLLNNAAKTVPPPDILSGLSDQGFSGTLSFKLDLSASPGKVIINGQLKNGSVTRDFVNREFTLDTNNKLIVTDPDLAGLEIQFAQKANDGAEYNFSFGTKGLFGNIDENKAGPKTVYAPDNVKDEAEQGIFDVLFAARDLFRDDSIPDFKEKVDELIGKLGQQGDHILQQRVAEGARVRHFESLEDQLLDQEVKLTQSMEKIEGADVARLSIEAAQQELAYNASLAVGAKILSTSLLDFLR